MSLVLLQFDLVGCVDGRIPWEGVCFNCVEIATEITSKGDLCCYKHTSNGWGYIHWRFNEKCFGAHFLRQLYDTTQENIRAPEQVRNFLVEISNRTGIELAALKQQIFFKIEPQIYDLIYPNEPHPINNI